MIRSATPFLESRREWSRARPARFNKRRKSVVSPRIAGSACIEPCRVARQGPAMLGMSCIEPRLHAFLQQRLDRIANHSDLNEPIDIACCFQESTLVL